MIIYKGRWERKNGVGHKMVESETGVLENDSNKGKEVITGWSREGKRKRKKKTKQNPRTLFVIWILFSRTWHTQYWP